jgi:hypothetical protein
VTLKFQRRDKTFILRFDSDPGLQKTLCFTEGFLFFGVKSKLGKKRQVVLNLYYMKLKSLVIALVIVVFAGLVVYFFTSQKKTPTQDSKVVLTTEDKISAESEKWENTPAEIKKLYIKDSFSYLSLDVLSPNPNFLPGENDFFINQNDKLREVKIDDNTRFYKCGPGPDNQDTTADVESDVKELRASVIYYFDITDSLVKNIYEQCLP